MNGEQICLVIVAGIAGLVITIVGIVWTVLWYKINAKAIQNGYVRRSLPGCPAPVWTKDREA